MARKPAEKTTSARRIANGAKPAATEKASPGGAAAAAKKSEGTGAPARRAAAESSPRAKKSVNPPSARERLADELMGLIPEIDPEGLLFLIRQANVLVHNKRVDELNAEMEKLNAGKRAREGRGGTTARVGESAREVTVEIQRSPDGKTYYLMVNGEKHFLANDEMKAVVRLCFKPERKTDALGYLNQYFYDERREILMDHGITTGKHPFFEALFSEVRAKFTVDQ